MTQTLRLCTWNIQLGYRLETVLRVLQENPDFATVDLLALQEASLHADRQDSAMIAAALGPAFQFHQVTAHFIGKAAQANALIWNTARFDILRLDTVKLPSVEQVHLPQAERTLLGALPRQQRISIVADGTLGAQPLRFYIAHLDVIGVTHKYEQFRHILLDAGKREPSVPMTIVAGDLNTFRFRSRPTWAALTGLAKSEGFQDLTTAILWTHRPWRRVRFHQKLDAIFVQSGQPYQYKSWSLVVPGSDHIPVFADITLSFEAPTG